MPKKVKARKNAKNKPNDEKRNLIEADLDNQVYGTIEKALGSRFFEVNCLDNKKRRCKVRNKRMKIKVTDTVIISLREFDDNNADIIYKYEDDEVRVLQKKGIIPENVSVNMNGEIEIDSEDDVVFDFDDI
jgi:translation initiation factor 1A